MNGTTSAEVTLARIVQVKVTEDSLSVDLEDGRTISVPIGWFPRLVHGTPAERANAEISGAGLGIHWPNLDEDIGVEGPFLIPAGKFSVPCRVAYGEQTQWLASAGGA